MASDFKYSTAARNAKMDGLTAHIGGGAKIQIFSGTKPANVATAPGAATMLVELTGATPFAPAASGGVITANAITSGTAVASGAAAWFRVYKADGTTAVFDGTVGQSGTGTFDMVIDNTNIASGQTIAVTGLTITSQNG